MLSDDDIRWLMQLLRDFGGTPALLVAERLEASIGKPNDVLGPVLAFGRAAILRAIDQVDRDSVPADVLELRDRWMDSRSLD